MRKDTTQFPKIATHDTGRCERLPTSKADTHTQTRTRINKQAREKKWIPTYRKAVKTRNRPTGVSSSARTRLESRCASDISPVLLRVINELLGGPLIKVARIPTSESARYPSIWGCKRPLAFLPDGSAQLNEAKAGFFNPVGNRKPSQ